MTMTPRQLVLEIPHRPALGLEDFLVSQSNNAAVDLVDRWPDWPIGAAVIAGPAGSGKSHLANVWCLRSNARMLAAADVTLAEVPALANAGALVIEDIDKETCDEQALFHLLNLVSEQRLAILITTATAPGDLDIKLPDLRSRIRALPVAEIAPPDDALLRAVLVKLFADRQLAVEPHVIDYVLVRMERSTHAAQRLVSAADRLALAMQRAVTRPVAAAALDAIEEAEKPG